MKRHNQFHHELQPTVYLVRQLKSVQDFLYAQASTDTMPKAHRHELKQFAFSMRLGLGLNAESQLQHQHGHNFSPMPVFHLSQHLSLRYRYEPQVQLMKYRGAVINTANCFESCRLLHCLCTVCC